MCVGCCYVEVVIAHAANATTQVKVVFVLQLVSGVLTCASVGLMTCKNFIGNQNWQAISKDGGPEFQETDEGAWE
jgi:hypothetical protein